MDEEFHSPGNGKVIRFLPEVKKISEETERLGIELKTFLDQKNSSLSFEDKFQLLRQISLCLLRHHNEEIALDELSHSRIFIRSRAVETKKGADIRLLADLYCFILTKTNKTKYEDTLTEKDLNCDDPDIALDLMRKIAKGEITIEEVLQHPFHWSCFQKVHFLCRTVDCVNEERRVKQVVLDQIGKDGSIIPSCGWVEKLRLNKNDIKRLEKLQKDAGDQNMPPPKINLIHDKAMKSAETDTKRRSLYELLRFFRNRYCHPYEDENDIKACFDSYPEGYWKFFSSRFPKLFMLVYTKMKADVLTKYCMGEFETNESSNSPVYNVHLHV